MVKKLKSATEPLSVNMKTSLVLLEVFLVAIIIALIVTIMNSVFAVQILAITLVFSYNYSDHCFYLLL